jgi:hypothetical protein
MKARFVEICPSTENWHVATRRIFDFALELMIHGLRTFGLFSICWSATICMAQEKIGLAQEKAQAVKIIFDTDIEDDVDDVGAVAVLHALANRGEADILAMGVSSKHEWSAPCLDALNTYFGRPNIPIGVIKGPGPKNDSKYCRKIAEEFPHDLKSADDAPDAVTVYRKILAKQADQSVVMVSVGFLTNFANLIRSKADEHSPLSGVELVKQKVRSWVCMGAEYPKGKEWNIYVDAKSSIEAVKHWPTPIVWSGFEIGVGIQTGVGLKAVPQNSPVRRGYEHFNGLTNHPSWDQTAVLYAVRGLKGELKDVWNVGSGGYFQIHDDGSNTWVAGAQHQHFYLIAKMPTIEVAKQIEALMLEQPQRKP